MIKEYVGDLRPHAMALTLSLLSLMSAAIIWRLIKKFAWLLAGLALFVVYLKIVKELFPVS